MRDPELAEAGAEARGGERACRCRCRASASPGAMPRSAAARVDDGDRLRRAAAEVERPADDLARAAVDRGVQVAPAVLGDPDEVMSRCQSWSGRSTRKKPGPAPAALGAAALQQPVLAHQPLHALAVDRPRRARATRAPRPSGAVGRVRARDLEHDAIDVVQRAALAGGRSLRVPNRAVASFLVPADGRFGPYLTLRRVSRRVSRNRWAAGRVATARMGDVARTAAVRRLHLERHQATPLPVCVRRSCSGCAGATSTCVRVRTAWVR